MTRWSQQALDVIFVAAEAVAWYMVIRLIATVMEQSFLEDVTLRLQSAIATRDVNEVDRAAAALDAVRRAMDTEHGPPLLLVLLTALTAFALMRTIVTYEFNGPLGAALLVAGSLVALNVVLHVTVARDLRLWDTSGLASALGSANTAVAGRLDVDAFIRRPELGEPHRAAVGFMFCAMIGMWLRFLLAGRSRVTFERVLRSFTIGFVVVLATVLVARSAGLERLTIFAVPQFVLGMLGLAVANHIRAAVPADGGAQRTGPWLAAVGGTLALLVGVAMLLGLLAFLNIGPFLVAVGDVASAVIRFLLIALITPVFWLMQQIVGVFGEGVFDRMLENFGQMRLPEVERPPDTEGGPSVPGWLENGLKFLAVVALTWAAYRLALLVLGRRRVLLATVAEVRGNAEGGVGLGDLLRGLLPRAARRLGGDWTTRQAIYRLYARAVAAAEARGYRYLAGETPLEFAAGADHAMAAAPFTAIGGAFDRARYGRHYPSSDEVRAMDEALSAWEVATPPTEELRDRLAGAVPMSEQDELELLMTERRQRRPRRGQPNPPPIPPPQME